jgi:hypothetical protein
MKKLPKISYLLFALILISLFGTIIYIEKRNHKAKSVADILKHHYANAYVNHPEKKAQQINKILRYLSEQKDYNWDYLNEQINKIEDGHLYLINSNPWYQSNIEVSNELELIINDGGNTSYYPIVKVDDLTTDLWLEKSHFLIAASTSWGRNYKLIQLLHRNQLKKEKQPKTITIKKENKEVVIALHWELAPSTPCVEVEKRDDYNILKIKTLWCQKKDNESYNEILQNFKDDFQQAWNQIDRSKELVVDLRGNQGGGDDETIFALEHLITKQQVMYHYQYLNKNIPFPHHLLNRENKLWQKKQQDLVRPNSINQKPKALLIDAGCSSSCEVIASVLKNAEKVPTFGKRTHGCAGGPYVYHFNEALSLSYPTLVLYHENGELYEGVGVAPDFEVEIKEDLNFLR